MSPAIRLRFNHELTRIGTNFFGRRGDLSKCPDASGSKDGFAVATLTSLFSPTSVLSRSRTFVEWTLHPDARSIQNVRVNPRKDLPRPTLLRSRGFFRWMLSKVVLKLRSEESPTGTALQVFLAA